MLWTNQVLPLLLQRDSLNTSRSKDRTVSLFFLPKPLHSPHPLGSYIALPSSRSLFKTNMVKVCARSRRSNGKIGDCEQSIHEVNIALFKRLSTRKRLPLFLTSQCNPNQPSHSQVQSTKRDAMEDLTMNTPRKITTHRQRSVLFWRSEPYLVGRLANTSSPLKSASML